MRKTWMLFCLILAGKMAFAQQKIEKLQYAKTEIKVPEQCEASSEYEIFDCNGFSAQWLFLKNEMVEQNVHQQLFSQIEQQMNFKTKKELSFNSQNQPFTGYEYELDDGGFKIIGFGKVDDIFLILNLGFDKKTEKNKDLNEFEKNFITFVD